MLFLSSLAAALAPVEQRESTSTSSSSSTSTNSTGSARAGELIIQSLDLPASETPNVKAQEGDQLQLRITSKQTGTIELVALGVDADVGPNQPALFDVLLVEPGTYPVRFLGKDEDLATITVR